MMDRAERIQVFRSDKWRFCLPWCWMLFDGIDHRLAELTQMREVNGDHSRLGLGFIRGVLADKLKVCGVMMYVMMPVHDSVY